MSASSQLTVGFVSLGCAKNLVDSQIMADVLLSAEIQLAPSPEEADVVIVNTCAFVEDAREESVASVLDVCRLKQEGSCRAVLVAGCMPQRYRDDLRESLPDVDAFIGLDQLEDVAGIVKRLAAGEQGIVEVSRKAERLFEPEGPGVVFSTGPYAYLKIAEGCDHRCAFCAIPGIRGAYRSRSEDAVVREAERLLDRGFRELALISQDVTCYGRDHDDGASLPGLVRALGRIGGDFWIRLLYGYPSHITDALLEAMGEVPQVCRYLDIPIQHSHPDILRAMQRAETVEAVESLAGRVRAVMPDITLRTTCIVGFPGETERHVQHLLQHITATAYDHVGVFTFSPEAGTAAASLPDCPGAAEAHERRLALLEAQREIVDSKAAALINTPGRALLSSPLEGEERVWIGRSSRQAPEVDGDTFVEDVATDARPGDFVDIIHTAQSEYDMIGHVAGVKGP